MNDPHAKVRLQEKAQFKTLWWGKIITDSIFFLLKLNTLQSSLSQNFIIFFCRKQLSLSQTKQKQMIANSLWVKTACDNDTVTVAVLAPSLLTGSLEADCAAYWRRTGEHAVN